MKEYRKHSGFHYDIHAAKKKSTKSFEGHPNPQIFKSIIQLSESIDQFKLGFISVDMD